MSGLDDASAVTANTVGTAGSVSVGTAGTEHNLKALPKKRFKFVNPLAATQRVFARRKVREERRLLRREELMKQDAERYLMELEEKNTWLVSELRERNFTRMVREENVRYFESREKRKEEKELLEREKEQGLSYFRGQITGYRRWQNSAAKHLDIVGHEGPVAAVKLSSCLRYIVSCSQDKTIKLWALRSGKCLLTFSGHTKKVNDVSFHPKFAMDSADVCLVSCASDCTLRFWSCVMPDSLKVVNGHTEAVYRCSFSPGGQRVVSCSEDQTARVWTVPEGFLLFIYQAHQSPVTTVKFSPSGRYLVTGSDYGERKLLLWDASCPRFNVTAQFPHMIFWSPEGLIRKILMRKATPSQHFWMTQKQLNTLDEEEMVETWPGENATLEDIASDSESGSEGDDDGAVIEDDDFGKGDVKDEGGAIVMVTAVDKEGQQQEATEYIAGGGTLVVSLQSIIEPIAEAFVSVNLKEHSYDSYSSQSGARVGHFKASDPIPWREFVTDPLNIRPPHRLPPRTVKETCNGKAFQYKEIRQFNRITGEEILPSVAVEMLWTSPPPNMGPVVVTANIRLRNEKFWRKLTYSLKESPIRLNSGEDDSVAEDGDRYIFNQEERHDVFWRYVREQNWEAVESFFENKCALFFEDRMFIRKRRILGLLRRIFGTPPEPKKTAAGTFTFPLESEKKKKEYKHVVLAWPFIHVAGQTRSSAMVEDLEVFPDNKSAFSSLTYREPEVDDEVKIDPDDKSTTTEKNNGVQSDNQGVTFTTKPENIPETVDLPATTPLMIDTRAAVGNPQDGGGEECENQVINISMSMGDPPLEVADGDVSGGGVELTTEVNQSSRDSARPSTRGSEADKATGSARGALEVEISAGSGVSEEKSDGDESEYESSSDSDSSGSSYSGSDSSSSGDDTDSSESSSDSNGSPQPKTKLSPIKEESPLKLKTPVKGRIKATSPTKYSRLPSRTKSTERKTVPLPSSKKKSSFSLLRKIFGKTKKDAVLKYTPSDGDKDLTDTKAHRRRAHGLAIPKIIYTEPVEGKEFQRKMKRIAAQEASTVFGLEMLGIPVAKESRQFTNKGYTVEDMAAIGDTPHWLMQHLKIGEDGDVLENPVDAEDMEPDVPNAKDGRFGPRAEGLSMPLPDIFPHRAGLAKEALKANLKKDEKAKAKIEKKRIPTTSEALRMKNEKENRKLFEAPEWLKNKKKAKEMAAALELEVGMNIMLNSGYPAGRRESLTSLPGMTNHYPNPNYKDVALIPYGYVDQRNESRTLYRTLFSRMSKKKTSTEVIVGKPVGRKPVSLCSQQPVEVDGNASLTTVQDLARTAQDESSIGNASNLGIDNETAASVLTSGETKPALESEAGTRPGTSVSHSYATNQRNITGGDVSVVSGSAPAGSRTDATLDTRTASGKQATAPNTDTGDAPAPLLGEIQHSQASFMKNKKTKNFFLKATSIPDDVYLDRRGSFHIAPGLESFSKYLEEKRDPLKNKKYDDYGRPIQVGKSSTLKTSNVRKDTMEAAGLICVMHTNGFDVAHQGTINDALFSPSENRIASCGGDHLIKLWDPRDGSFVRRLVGHTAEVTALCYTTDELYLVSAGGDHSILIWDLTVFKVTRTLRGHADVINGLCISHDCSFVVSCSYDNLIKSWFLTPRNPDPPLPPRIVTKTENTVMIQWQAPPSFNEPITGFHLQYKIPGQVEWFPRKPISIPPHYRQKTVTDLSPCTTYQFRLRATNRMGESEWGAMSKLVKTKSGLPLQLERPDISDVTKRSVSIYFFTPNPKLFGAAPTKFVINWSGEGRDFEDSKYELTLEDGVENGHKLAKSFAYWTSEEGQRKRRRMKKNTESNIKNGSSIDVPQQTMEQVLERYQHIEDFLLSVEVPGMRPGNLYRFRVAGINMEGQGPWSDASFSQGTMPAVPDVPEPPVRIAHDLTWITFKWHAPNDNGSAIVGYRIWIKHINYYTDLPRWQNTYQCTRLLPGENYYIKVLAKNAVGWSEYSEYNSLAEAETATAAPDTPLNPTAIGAGWGYMTLEARLPYPNGREITQLFVQHREIQAFSKGQWSTDIKYELATDVEILDETPREPEIEREEESDVEDNGKVKKKKALKKFPNRKKFVRMATGVLEETVIQIDTSIDKPKGRRIVFDVKPLKANTLYEYRISFQNETGRSEFSIPSQRAKTRLPEAPAKMKAPRCMEIMPNFINISFVHPANGGDEIVCFFVKLHDTVHDSTQMMRVLPHFSDYKIEGLKPGGAYRICMRADNEVGEGPFSNWTKIVHLPKEKVSAQIN